MGRDRVVTLTCAYEKAKISFAKIFLRCVFLLVYLTLNFQIQTTLL